MHLTILEMEGHLIDSLTLAKVIDKIQHAGVDYQINDLQIGLHKHDISMAQISVWTPEESDLSELLSELRTYGAFVVPNSEVVLRPCPQDGKAPADAYLRANPPIEVKTAGQWIAVERQGWGLVIVVEGGTARMERVAHLKQGDKVVCGLSGVKVLPTLSAQRAG